MSLTRLGLRSDDQRLTRSCRVHEGERDQVRSLSDLSLTISNVSFECSVLRIAPYRYVTRSAVSIPFTHPFRLAVRCSFRHMSSCQEFYSPTVQIWIHQEGCLLVQ